MLLADRHRGMVTAREFHTATLLPDGTVLVAGGTSNRKDALASAERYDPSSGTWTATGSMIEARAGHTATLLPDGRVLVAGGGDDIGDPLASAELYDPSNGTWTATGKMDGGRVGHTATLLPDGTVLVAGGLRLSGGDYHALASAALYDPSSGSWTATGNMDIEARYGHTATLLPDGMVLVAGGEPADGTLFGSADLYDPSRGSWTATGGMIQARSLHTATLLADGKVLVAGGSLGDLLPSAELYDPGSGSWTATGNMIEARVGHRATLLPDGTVLVACGGHSDGSDLMLAPAELYDPSSGSWTATGNMIEARVGHTATLLPDGTVLVAGGRRSSRLAILWARATHWLARALAGAALLLADRHRGMIEARYNYTATLLPDGKVLVAGGSARDLASAELYDPSSGSWTATGNMDGVRSYHTATLLPDGKVLVAGGSTFMSGPVASAELFDPGNGSWTPTRNMIEARHGPTATLLPDGKVLVAGGSSDGFSDGPLASAELYDPSSGSWTPAGNMIEARVGHTATLLPDGKVLVVGGDSGSIDLASAELYDPSSVSWTATGNMIEARVGHTATLLPDGKVLAAGGDSSSASGSDDLLAPELYDPGSGSWTATANMDAVRVGHTATRLPDGKVLVAGGDSDRITVGGGARASAQLYDPGSGSWTATANMTEARSYHTATLLPDGNVLVAGGLSSGGALASAELYDPGSGS